jgi:hypothetical protein
VYLPPEHHLFLSWVVSEEIILLKTGRKRDKNGKINQIEGKAEK